MILHVLFLGLKLKVFYLVARSVVRVGMHVMPFGDGTVMVLPHPTVQTNAAFLEVFPAQVIPNPKELLYRIAYG